MKDIAALLAGYPVVEPVGNNNPANRHEPTDPAEKFAARVLELQQRSGRERSWCLQRCRESHPDEAAAYSARRDAGWRG